MARRRTDEVPQAVIAASPPTGSDPVSVDVPATLGDCADLLYGLRAERLALEAQADAVKAREARVREYLEAELAAQGLTAVVGATARAGLTTTWIGHVQDWDVFADHVFATRDLSLLQRRLNDAALRERWEAGEAVPGVEPFLVTKISLTKAR